MNRRGFLGALMGFAVLPSATQYKRIWKFAESGIILPSMVSGSLFRDFEMAACGHRVQGLYDFLLERTGLDIELLYEHDLSDRLALRQEHGASPRRLDVSAFGLDGTSGYVPSAQRAFVPAH